MSNPITTEACYDDDELEFALAVDKYRRESHRQFPANSELLAILKSLGYRKVEEKTPLPKFKRHGK